ncbi:adenylate/guanylate cyclase domain-containing protein [Nocardioides sp. 616]|uniref:adenylate/guanylate cyclase domain-containing protein n=1 Tax=Nocardioides sp. 616 TaxID=2268090 RepID=UPI000CE4ACDD|nr:adenylate/guanylate cyclase domain-containing protein [Nocardioides sp. 616]
MNAFSASRFGDTVMNDYRARRARTTGPFEKSLMASASSSPPILESNALGHPQFEDLAIGERRTENITALFLDLTDFTSRSFWDDAIQVVDLAHAVLTGFIETVLDYGGFPLGLRGDGLFAGFGPGNAPVGAGMALAACAYVLEAVQADVNPRLRSEGIEPVQVRAGLDHGPITFVRTGAGDNSEINPLGFAANFAAKCEKKANSWEIVVGEGLRDLLPDYDHFSQHPDSPRSFQRDGQRRFYRFYDYRWRNTLKHIPGTVEELAGNPASAIAYS